MRIRLISHGTRGDVQPLANLALELRRRGHDVAMGVPTNLLGMAAALDLPAVGLTFDTAAILASPRGIQAMQRNDFYRLSVWLAELHHAKSRELDAAVVEACDGADLIVSNFMLEERAAVLAEAHDLPLASLHVMPLRSSRAIPSPLMTTRNLGAPLNRATHALFTRIWWSRLRPDTDEFRRSLGLAPERRTLPARPSPNGRVELQAYSPLLVPELARDWAGPDGSPSPDRPFTGFVRPTAAERAAMGADDLDAWLDAGTPPVYMGFGSMPMADPAGIVAMVTAAARDLGRRVLLGGVLPPDVAAGLDPEWVHQAHEVDFGAVLPRTAAVVHHGGAGTLDFGLRAGRPTLVCSFWTDQPFWGDRVRRLGVGEHLRFYGMDARSFTRALAAVLEEPVARRAAEFGARLAAEPDGATAAADALAPLLSATARP